MIKFFLATVLAFSFTTSFAQHYKEKYGQPLLVLTEMIPDLGIDGAGEPSFALYENGQIIYKKRAGDQYKFFQVVYDKDKIQGIFKSLGVTDTLMKESGYYLIARGSDQPTVTMLVKSDSTREISMYGNFRDDEKVRAATPRYFLTAYDNILKFEDSAATEWLPDSIEVQAWNYSHTWRRPLKWNAAWSDIDNPTTIKLNEWSYSIYLDKKYFSEFISLLKKMRRGRPVKINGKKYFMSYFLPFPNIW